MKKHFVTFYSPGTFMAEDTTKPIDSWDVAEAVRMSKQVTERYGATPFGFRFSTRARGPEDLDSKVIATSGMYFLAHMKVETFAEVKARDLPDEKILRSNMEGNGWDRIVTSTSGWRCSQPLKKGDVALSETK